MPHRTWIPALCALTACLAVPALARAEDAPMAKTDTGATSVALTEPLHATAIGGETVELSPGEWTVSAAEGALVVAPGGDGATRRLEATAGTHSLEIGEPVALLTSDATGGRRLTLLLPSGRTLETTGTGGVAARGATARRVESQAVVIDRVTRVQRSVQREAAGMHQPLAKTAGAKTPASSEAPASRSRSDAPDAAPPSTDVMEALFFVFRESIEEQNEDKKAWMAKVNEVLGPAAEEVAEDLQEAKAQCKQSAAAALEVCRSGCESTAQAACVTSCATCAGYAPCVESCRSTCEPPIVGSCKTGCNAAYQTALVVCDAL